MYTDKGKKIIDVGEIGNASTGDILYDGGVKINDNFDAIYNAFADQRLFAAGGGALNQKIHATSYYQKIKFGDANSAGTVPMGSCLDADCSEGAVQIRLSKGKAGEAVFVVNSNGSASKARSIKITTNGEGVADAFKDGSRELIINTPRCRVELWCVEVKANGAAVWDYSISSMFGSTYSPLEATYNLTSSPINIRLGYNDDYSTVKLLLSFSANPGGQTIKRQSSEVMLMIDPTITSSAPNGRVFDTEYAVLRSGESSENEKMYSISYSINAQKDLICTASTSYGNARLAVKVIATQTVGVSQ